MPAILFNVIIGEHIVLQDILIAAIIICCLHITQLLEAAAREIPKIPQNQELRQILCPGGLPHHQGPDRCAETLMHEVAAML